MFVKEWLFLSSLSSDLKSHPQVGLVGIDYDPYPIVSEVASPLAYTQPRQNVNKKIEAIGVRQWRIQDFPEEGAPTIKVGALTCYLVKKFPKTA